MAGKLLALGIAGCSAYSVRLGAAPASVDAAQDAGLARLCVVRKTAIGAALTTPVRDNGLTVGATAGPSWFCWHAGPGLHTLTTEVSDAPALELDVLAGEERLIEHRVNIGQDQLIDRGDAEPSAPAVAAAELGATRYATLDGMNETATAPVLVVPGLKR
ncbi:MAG: hypothetical protein IV100_25285 [Myxococcales bacterium]|nr:hypothetical protein [Myxococcales bacterium]